MSAGAVVHAAVLALVNLVSIVIGFLVFALVRGGGQLAVQVPVAIVLTVVLFAGWTRYSSMHGPRRIRFRGPRDGYWIFGLAPIWAAVVFVPLHFVTQGYPTAFSNLTALWSFQVFANLIAVTISVQLRQREA